jgi:hypothetical protein
LTNLSSSKDDYNQENYFYNNSHGSSFHQNMFKADASNKTLNNIKEKEDQWQ